MAQASLVPAIERSVLLPLRSGGRATAGCGSAGSGPGLGAALMESAGFGAGACGEPAVDLLGGASKVKPGRGRALGMQSEGAGGDFESGSGVNERAVVAEDAGGMKPLLTREDLVKSPERAEPHVVILGAGASKAAFGGGDANGRLVPLMNELPEVLGDPWRELVEGANLAGAGFESQFTRLRESATHHARLDEIESMLLDYFSSLALPEHPTIYDYLVLG